jgi:hypothetical protein
MSQLNLKQILSGDNLSSVVDKLNYNFDQIILNGGGPQGLRGNLGSPGLPGAQGLRGFTGPTGEHGTYLFAEAGVGPTAYFATGGLPPSRIGDVYMDTYPTHLDIYELGATGWTTVEVMELPGGYWKSVYDNGAVPVAPALPVPATTSMSNDILLAEKLLVTDAAGASAYLVDMYANPGELKPELTANYLSTVMVGSLGNQLRLLSTDLMGTTHSTYWSTTNDTYFNQGGIIHSLEKAQNGSLDVQMYRILNADLYGDKYFSLNLNGGKVGSTGPDNLIINNSILYGDTNNRAGSGIDHFVPLKAQFNIQDSLIVGNSSFYNYNNHVLYKDKGIISQGNLSIGARDNTFYTGAFLGIDINNDGLSENGRVAIDTFSSIANSNTETSLSIGTDIFKGKGSVWNFTVDGYSQPSNTRFGSLTLGGQLCTTPNTPGATAFISYDNTMYFGLTSGTYGIRPLIGVANNDPRSLFEIGGGNSRISIGEMGGGGLSYDGSTYIGFNLHRDPVNDIWTKKSGVNSSGKAVWSGVQDTGLHFSFVPPNLPVALNDQLVTSLTRASIMTSGAFWNHPNTPALEGAAADVLGLFIGFGATGATGDMPFGSSFINPGQQFFRRPSAYFGEWARIGSPVIFANAGLTQSIFTTGDGVGALRNVLPQYSFYGASDYGMYLAEGNPVNLGTWLSDTASVGLSVAGVPGVHVSGNNFVGARVGIATRTPYERFQIGDRLTVHDGGNKYFGYNVYYDVATNSDRRIFGDPVGTLEGYAKTQYFDYNYIGSFGASRFSNTGTKIAFEVGNPNDVNQLINLTSTSSNGKVYRGVMISPPLQANASTHFNNATHVPQVGIGVKLDTDGNSSSNIDSIGTGKRGTLAIAAQMRHKPYSSGIGGMTTEDYYNIGLYSYDGYPVAGIQAAGGNPNTYTTRSLSLNLIGDSGNALYEDLTVLYSESDINLTAKHQRKVQFGNSFRVGINSTPQSLNTPQDISIQSLWSGLGHDIASLVVAGATAYYANNSSAYHPASIHKGSVVIDQTPIWNTATGVAEGLWIKDGSIIGTTGGNQPNNGGIGIRTTPTPVNTYAGDWNIRYRKLGVSGEYPIAKAGLSIGKPTFDGNLTSNLFYIDDTGSVGIGSANFDISNPGYLRNGPATINTPATLVSNILFPRYGSVHDVDNGTSGININGFEATTDNDFSTISTAIPPYSLFIPPAKLSVNGIIKLQGFVSTTSDERLKTELGRINKGESLDAIIKIKPVLFQWNEKSTTPGHIQLGLFAQEVEEIIPEAVRSFKSENFDDEKQLDYNSIFVMAIGAIKDQQDIIEKQAETIKNLESKLSKIEELLERNNIL